MYEETAKNTFWKYVCFKMEYIFLLLFNQVLIENKWIGCVRE